MGLLRKVMLMSLAEGQIFWKCSVHHKHSFYLLMVVRLCYVDWIEVGWDFFFFCQQYFVCLAKWSKQKISWFHHHYRNSEGQSDFFFLSASMSLLHLHFLLCNKKRVFSFAIFFLSLNPSLLRSSFMLISMIFTFYAFFLLILNWH